MLASSGLQVFGKTNKITQIKFEENDRIDDISEGRASWWHRWCWLKLRFGIFLSMLLRCAYSLCVCGRRVCESELLRARSMLSECSLKLRFGIFLSMLLRCAYSLCACGRRICESELLRARSMLREGEHPDGIDDLG